MSDTISIKDARVLMTDGALEFPVKLKLKKPINIGSELKEFVTFANEPTAGDIASLPTGEYKMGDFFPVLSKVLGEPVPTVINKLSIPDMQACMEILNHFLLGSEEDGDQV